MAKIKYNLKPCPFCGGPVHFFTDRDEDGDKWTGVRCDNEECVGWDFSPMYPDKADAADHWNRRASGEVQNAFADWGNILLGIRDRLGKAEMLAQLAEEASELSQAALKARRVIDGRNPTPMSYREAADNLQEEMADVLLCMVGVGMDEPEIARTVRAKIARWATRLEEENEL